MKESEKSHPKDKSKDKDKKKDKDKESKDTKDTKDKDRKKEKEKDKDKKKKDISEDEIDKSAISDKPSNLYNNNNNNNNNININNDHIEKCDGCYVQDGIVYCTNCEKIYCKLCEDQIHIIPRMRSHNRIPVDMMYNLKKLCFNHGNKLNLYCETCEEPICSDCFNLGPHNTRLHRVVTTSESFKRKYNELKMIVKTNLKRRYDLYLDQIQFLDFNIEEIKNNKSILEKNIQQEYLTMSDKLKVQEGKKMSVLNYESSLIQKEINKIHDACNFVSENTMQNSPDMLDFLLKFKKMKDSIESMLSKPVKSKFSKKLILFITIYY